MTNQFVSGVLLNVQAHTLVDQAVEMPSFLDTPRGISSGKFAPNSIALADGILDVSALATDGDAELRPHSPLFFSPTCLPYRYDAHARAPRWAAFLKEVLPAEESREVIQEFFGYCLVHDTTQHRFLILEGDGRNGKGVVCHILGCLLGKANTSSVPLAAFDDRQRFRLTETLGKLANIVSESATVRGRIEDNLKAFVAGDPMQFERKYQEPFTAKPTARLVVATNSRPHFADPSEGFWQRIILVHFPVVIPAEQRNPDLGRELEAELAGVFNWALEGLQHLRSRGRFLDTSESAAAKEEWRDQSNPARVFLGENCVSDPNGEAPTHDVYRRYVAWAENRGFKPPLNDVYFGREVRRAYPDIKSEKASRVINGERQRVYKGLRLLPAGADAPENGGEPDDAPW